MLNSGVNNSLSGLDSIYLKVFDHLLGIFNILGAYTDFLKLRILEFLNFHPCIQLACLGIQSSLCCPLSDQATSLHWCGVLYLCPGCQALAEESEPISVINKLVNGTTLSV